jgi:hypothetical protein
MGSPPTPDQLEVTLIGPGYGECAVVHLGNGRWMIVDSCIDKPSATPAAIKHLSELGIRPEESVDLIIMTHGTMTTLEELPRFLKVVNRLNSVVLQLSVRKNLSRW